MDLYATTHQTPAGTNLTILEIVAPGTTRRGRICEFGVSSDSTPADVATEFQIIRGTVSGTGTARTGRLMDPASPPAVLLPEGGTFATQTKTADSDLWEKALNQRASYRWVSQPKGEMLVPAVADNWVGLESIASGGTPNINSYFHWWE